jgi:hypothetical protein
MRQETFYSKYMQRCLPCMLENPLSIIRNLFFKIILPRSSFRILNEGEKDTIGLSEVWNVNKK